MHGQWTTRAVWRTRCTSADAWPFFQGDLAAAWSVFEESPAAHRELGDRPMVASVLGFLGRVATERGDYAETHRHHGEILAIKRELGLRRYSRSPTSP